VIVLSAAVVAIVFAAGTFLLLQRDLFRIVAGILTISNAATLFIIASGLSRGQAPILPLDSGPVSDPVSQALALTALVIGFAVAALLLVMVYRLYLSHHSLDAQAIQTSERRSAALQRREGDPYVEEVPEEEIDEDPGEAQEREVTTP